MVNGGKSNVPACMDQFIDQLPNMSSEVQLHARKHKRILTYKSHYVYHFIIRNVVISAIKWCVDHNNFYADIKINENWVCKCMEGHLSSHKS